MESLQSEFDRKIERKEKLYNLTNIRALLNKGFTGDELRRLCYDVPDFRCVYDELASNTNKSGIIDRLLDYAERRLLLDTLLALAKDQNPARYDHHQPYYSTADYPPGVTSDAPRNAPSAQISSNRRIIVPYIVDRDEELGLLRRAIEEEFPSILLFEDKSGQGKTKLLKLYEEYCKQQSILVSNVSIKTCPGGPIEIMHRIKDDLRPLPCCTEFLLTNSKGLERQRDWKSGADCLGQDLKKITGSPPLKRVVLLFDTFENAGTQTRDFITRYILQMATPDRVPGLIIVLAGQKIPDKRKYEWGKFYHCYERLLKPLEVEDWLEYAKYVGATITRELRELIEEMVRDKKNYRALEIAMNIDREGEPNVTGLN